MAEFDSSPQSPYIEGEWYDDKNPQGGAETINYGDTYPDGVVDGDLLNPDLADESAYIPDTSGANYYTPRFTAKNRKPFAMEDGRAPQREPIVQRHRVGREVVNSEHPDPVVAEHVAGLIEKQVRQQDRLTEALDTHPNLNDTYAPESHILHAVAADKFGVDPPITIMSKEHLQSLAEELSRPDLVNSTAVGKVEQGHVIITTAGELLQNYGPQYLIPLGLHELGHAALPSYLTIATDLIPEEIAHKVPKDKIIQGQNGLLYRVATLKATGLAEPSDNMFSDEPIAKGIFWEEGRVDARRVRVQQELGMAVRGTGQTRVSSNAIVNGANITLTDEGMGTPHLSSNGTIAIPWKYAIALKMVGNRPQVANFPAVGVAAYALDLMEQHALPGITKQMDRAAVTRSFGDICTVSDRIDSLVGEGFYEAMSGRRSHADFARGLGSVIQALGIEKRTI